MACGIATLKMSSFEAFNAPRDRREQLSSAIVKTFALTNEVPQYLDLQTNPKEMHPVDLLARVVEAEGMRQLLTMTKKKELQKMCEYAGLDADMNDKRQVIKIILQTWTGVGTKKFLKKHVSDAHLAMICKNLGMSAPTSRPLCVEQIIRQLNIIGLENFSKKVTDENVKNILEQTSKGQQSEKLRTSQRESRPVAHTNGETRHANGETRHANGESRLQLPLEKSVANTSSRSPSREHGMAKSQEMKQKTPRSKGKDKDGKDSKSPRKEKEKDKVKKKS